MNILILKMGGTGTRFGSDIPKQYHDFNGEPLFCHVLREYEKLHIIDRYILVSNAEWIDYSYPYANKILGAKLYKIVQGGNTGAKSIKNGILCAKEIANEDDIVVMHDATNPIVVLDKVNDVIDAAKEYGFATLGQEQVHALYSKDMDDFAVSSLNKKTIVAGYSPEAFLFKYIYKCYVSASEEELETATSAIALANWHNLKAKIILASFLNLKITYKNDLELFKLIYSKKD